MESSIAEFLMRQLAPEQLPTSARLRTRCESFGTCARALPPSPTEGTALWSAAPHDHSQAAAPMESDTSRNSAATASLTRAFGHDQV